MARSKQKKDPVALIISIVVHSVVIGGVLFWVSTTEKGKELARRILQAVRSEKKQEQEPPKQQRAQPPASKLPPINQGVPQPASSGNRRAVAEDAPAAAGGSFFVDERKQTTGPSSGGSGTASNAPTLRVVLPPPVIAPPRLFASAPQPSTIKQLLADRAKAAASTESFGAEQISKSGVSDAGAIINKVSGAAVVDGKFPVIRGLNDRYITTTLNGGEIPSADPYRRSASLDIFPAQVIDKVVVAKTFTPDQPGTYTGGGINIVTKSFPEKPFANLSIGATYNSQATRNENFLTYSGGGRDWTGMDDGTRAIPKALASPNLVVPSVPANTGRPTNPDIYNQRFADANYIAELTRAMGETEFAPRREAPGPNYNFSAALGDTTHLLGRPFGVFAGLSYKRDFNFYENAVRRSYVRGINAGDFIVRSDYADTQSRDTVNWAGMVNFGYRLHEDHEVGFNFLYNQNSENIARQQVGSNTDDPGAIYHQNRLHFIERNLNTYQLKGTHRLPEVGQVKIDWLAGLAQTTQEEPDVRFFNYIQRGGDNETGGGNVPDPKNPTRYFRDLNEDNRNLKLDVTVPFRQWSLNEGEFKLGLFDSFSKRSFVDREVYYQGSAPFNGDPNAYLNAEDFGYVATTNAVRNVLFDWRRFIQTRDSAYDGEFGVRAGYLMVDVPLYTSDATIKLAGQPVFNSLRFVGGARYETTDLSINSRSYLANSITGQSTNSSKLEQADLLPGIGLIWALETNRSVRLSYSKTIARPSFRELAGYRSYDPTLDVLLDGNPLLQMTAIENFDFRWEHFPRPGELFSVSLFYKKLENAIERRFVTTDGDIVSFANRASAKVYGVEFEVRKNLDFLDRNLSYFSVGGNLSLIASETPLTAEEINQKTGVFGKGNFDTKRSLYDQSPYILNLDLSYDNPRLGTSASIVYNTAGPRIAVASLNTADIYEQPTPALDFILSQRIGRHASVKFIAKNLLNPIVDRTYGKDSDLLFSSFRKGMTFGLSLGYEF